MSGSHSANSFKLGFQAEEFQNCRRICKTLARTRTQARGGAADEEDFTGQFFLIFLHHSRFLTILCTRLATRIQRTSSSWTMTSTTRSTSAPPATFLFTGGRSARLRPFREPSTSPSSRAPSARWTGSAKLARGCLASRSGERANEDIFVQSHIVMVLEAQHVGVDCIFMMK